MNDKKSFATANVLPQYARSRTYDLRHIRLELRLDERRRELRGRATLSLSPINDGLRRIQVDLSDTLHVDSVQLESGRGMRWEHCDDRLEIVLPRASSAGREVRCVVAYHGAPRRGLYFVQPDRAFPGKPYQIWSQGQDEDSKFWFPCFDSPHEKSTSEIVITVRKRYTAVSNGRLVDVRDRGGWRTFHWREDAPHPAYLVSVVVGEFAEVREDVDGVTLHYYVPKPAERHVERTFGRTPEMLRFFSRALEYPYPYEKYAQVVVYDFLFGGMENITATTLTDAVLLDEVAAAETHCDGLIAHELAHQWWGNLLTCKEWSHAWLNEGFATYFEALFIEHDRGVDEFRWRMHGYAEDYFKEDAERYRRPIVERRYHKPIEIFDRHLYEKGACVLHMLRHELGEALFWKALRHYARKHEFQSVETADFKVAIEEATGRHLDAFFDQWVLAAGYPQLEIAWSWNAETRAVRLDARQKIEADSPPFALELDVELGFPAGPERSRVRLERAEHSVHLGARERPAYVRVDPDHWLLAKFEFTPSRAELLAQLQHARDLFGQIDAARGLARFVGDAELAAELRRALRRARFHAVRGEIATALARVAGVDAGDTLVRTLKGAGPRGRRRIVRALRELRDDPHTASTLLRHFDREPSYGVRAEIIQTLAAVRAKGAFDLCRRALRIDSFRDLIRGAALRALGELEEEGGIALAERHARYGGSRWARDAAMKALAALARANPPRAREIQRLLEGYLEDPSFFARISAAQALGELGRAQAVPALQRAAAADVDRRIQMSAKAALEKLQNESRNPESWNALQGEVRALREDNRDLHRRLERLESLLPKARRRRARRDGG